LLETLFFFYIQRQTLPDYILSKSVYDGTWDYRATTMTETANPTNDQNMTLLCMQYKYAIYQYAELGRVAPVYGVLHRDTVSE